MPLFIHPAEVIRPAATANDAKYCSQSCDITCAHDCSFLTNHRIVFDDDQRWRTISFIQNEYVFCKPSYHPKIAVYHPGAYISDNSPTSICQIELTQNTNGVGAKLRPILNSLKSISLNFFGLIFEFQFFDFFLFLSNLPGTICTIVALDQRTLCNFT